MGTVAELARMAGWAGRSYVSPDWDAVERTLGVSLPAEYKELLAVFPPGTFNAPFLGDGSVIVHPPYRVGGVPDQLHQFESEMDELRDWQAGHPADVPRPVFPEPGGMIPWARASRECLLWTRDSADPGRWAVAISNGGIWRYDQDSPVLEEFPVGAVDFLLSLVAGRITSRVLNPEGPDQPGPARLAAFEPVPEDEWRSFSVSEGSN
jgi:hypothetical protein